MPDVKSTFNFDRRWLSDSDTSYGLGITRGHDRSGSEDNNFPTLEDLLRDAGETQESQKWVRATARVLRSRMGGRLGSTARSAFRPLLQQIQRLGRIQAPLLDNF